MRGDISEDRAERADPERIVVRNRDVVFAVAPGRQAEMAPRLTRDLILKRCKCLDQVIGRQVARELLKTEDLVVNVV